MSKQHFVVNVGLARCGTTATEKFFSDHPHVSCPKDVKELKYFFEDSTSLEEYRTHFEDPDGSILFESSPPYCHVGLDRHTGILEKINAISADDHDVTILFCVRNLLSRAFSHYWHDIGVHYSRHGKSWAVRNDDNPNRYAQLYKKSFYRELKDPSGHNKFLPDVAGMITAAIEKFGVDRVKIAHTKQLDAGINDLMNVIDLPTPEPVILPRLPGATSPVYLFGGDEGRDYEFDTADGPQTLTVPAQACILFCRRHSELLTSDKFDVEAIVKASKNWSTEFDTATLPDNVKPYLAEQQSAFNDLPSQCFLGACRDALLADLTKVADKLSIKPMSTPYDQVKEHIWEHQAADASNDGKVIVGRNNRLFLHFDMNQVLPQHLGELLLSDTDVEKWCDTIEARTTYCAERGIPYGIIFAPDTHAVYPEDLAELDNRPGIRPMLQLLNAYKGDSVFYPIDSLKAARDVGEVCHVTDSHWTGFGAYTAYRDVMRQMPVDLRILGDNPNDVRIFDKMLVGDLGNKFTPHRTGRYTECAANASKTKKIWNNGVTNRGHMSFWTGNPTDMPRGLLLTDSYGWKFQRFMAESFSSLFVVHSPLLEKEAIERFKPDVVISLLAERFVPKVPGDETDQTAIQMAQVKQPGYEYPDLEDLIAGNIPS